MADSCLLQIAPVSTTVKPCFVKIIKNVGDMEQTCTSYARTDGRTGGRTDKQKDRMTYRQRAFLGPPPASLWVIGNAIIINLTLNCFIQTCLCEVSTFSCNSICYYITKIFDY